MARLYTLTNSVLWVDGTSTLGQINEIELPEIEWATIEHETIGLLGVPEFPTRLEPMEITITPMQFSPLLAQLSADSTRVYNFQLRSNIGEHNTDEKIGDIPHLVDFRGKFKTSARGTFGSEEMETEYTLSCSYYKERWNGQTSIEIDVGAPLYFANGVDLFADIRRNLGL